MSALVRRTVPLWFSSPSSVPVPIGMLRLDDDELNVAVACLSASIVSWHDPAPEQSPLQPPKLEPPLGGSVRADGRRVGEEWLSWAGPVNPGDETVPAPWT